MEHHILHLFYDRLLLAAEILNIINRNGAGKGVIKAMKNVSNRPLCLQKKCGLW